MFPTLEFRSLGPSRVIAAANAISHAVTPRLLVLTTKLMKSSDFNRENAIRWCGAPLGKNGRPLLGRPFGRVTRSGSSEPS